MAERRCWARADSSCFAPSKFRKLPAKGSSRSQEDCCSPGGTFRLPASGRMGEELRTPEPLFRKVVELWGIEQLESFDAATQP